MNMMQQNHEHIFQMQGMPFQNHFFGQQIQPMIMGIQHHQNQGFEQIPQQQPGPPMGMMPFVMMPQHNIDQFQLQQQFMQQQFQQQMAFNQHQFQQPNQSMIFPVKKKNMKPKIPGKIKNEVCQPNPEQMQFIPEIGIPIIEQFTHEPQFMQSYQPLRNSNQKKKQNINQKAPQVTMFDQQIQNQQIYQEKQINNQNQINSINNQFQKEKIQMINPQQICIKPTEKKIKSDQKQKLKQLDTNLYPQQHPIQSSRHQDNTPLRIIHKYPQPQQKNQIFNYQESQNLKNGKQVENQNFHQKLEYKKAEGFQTPQKQKYNENVQDSQQIFNIENQNFNCLVDMENVSKAMTSEKNGPNFNYKPLSIEFDNLEDQNFQNHSEFQVDPLFHYICQNPQSNFENQNSNFIFKNSNDYQVCVENGKLDINNQKSLNKSKKSQKKNNKNSQILNSFNYLSMTETGGQISVSSNHQITANCLRKCSKWTLKISDQNKKGNGITIQENSGIALRQMNYNFEKGLSKDQLNEKKRNLMMPKSSQYFENDIIDDMLIFENSLIFNADKKDFHDTNCLFFKNIHTLEQENQQINSLDRETLKNHKCCQPSLKMFNRYSQKSYLDQQIDLPFYIQMNTNSSLSVSSMSYKGDGSQTNEFDTFSQISSQMSEQSRQGSILNQVQGFQAKQNTYSANCNLDKYKELPLREQLIQILNVKQAENMFCIEFDLTGFPIQVPSNFEKTHSKEEIETINQEIENNRKFRVLNQTMIENVIQLKLSGQSHDIPIFSPSDFYLSFNIQGKKIIKSIQSRILDLKTQLSNQSRELHENKLKVHDQILNNPEKSLKFFLNQIEHNNKHGRGPWVTQTKQSLLVKLLNFNGKSIAFQLRIPQLHNLRNQMSNFNQLVLQEFEIEKIFICIDLPLSRINKIQAQNINDLDDYLIAKQIQPKQLETVKSPNIEQHGLSSGEQQQQSSSELTSQGTPLNLLNEYMAMQQISNQQNLTQMHQIHGFNSLNHFQQINQNTFNSNIQQQINQIKPFQNDQSENHQPIPDMLIKQNESNNSTNSNTGGSLHTEIENAKFEADNDGAESATFQTDANSQEIDNFNQINEQIEHNYKVPHQYQKQFLINNQMKDQKNNEQINSCIVKSGKDEFQQPTIEINNYFQQSNIFNSQIHQYNQQQEQIFQQAYYQQYFQIQGLYQNSQAYFPNNQFQNQQFQNIYPYNQFEKNDEIQDQQIQMMDQNVQFNSNFEFQQQEIIKHIPAPALQLEVQKGCYKIENFIKEDRSQMSNLDRFMEGTIPVGFNIQTDSLVDLLLAYHQKSMNGAQIEFQDERHPGQAQLFYFTPTLSSIYFIQKKNFIDSQKPSSKKKQTFVEFYEEQPPFKRKPLSVEMHEQTKFLLVNQKLDLNYKKKSIKIKNQISQLIENSDDSSSAQSGDFEDNQPSINEQFKTQYSWFSILWTCQKKIKVKDFIKSSLNQDNDINEHENFKQNNNIQFLVFYKFSEEPQQSDIEIIGMLSNKMDREGFWVTPCQMNCENELEGILFDEIYDNNIIRLQDMQEKAIKFIKDQGCETSSHDFQFFVKSLQPDVLSKNQNHLFQNDFFDGWQLIQKLKEQENQFL